MKSTAKGISNIDIAVIVRNPDKHTKAEIGNLYSLEFDVVLFHRLPLLIQFEVLKYEKKIFCRNEKCLLEIKRKALREYLEVSHMYERIRKRVLHKDSRAYFQIQNTFKERKRTSQIILFTTRS